jgi:phage terminase large subunit-like protein
MGPVLEFPQSPQRMTPATTVLYEAVVNGTVTHSGDPRLTRDTGNATVRTDNRGTRIYKEHKHSTRRIDLAVCAIMAYSVAATIGPGLQRYWYDEAS